MDKSVVKRLVSIKNNKTVQLVCDMTIKDKRKMFSDLRRFEPFNGENLVFPNIGGITLGEFCTSHVLQTHKKRKWKE